MALNLGTAWIQISPSMKGFRQKIEKELGAVDANAAARGINVSLSGAMGAVGRSGVAAMATVSAAAAGVATAIAGIAVRGGIDRALAIEGAQSKLRGLGHSAESVTEIMNNATAAVKGTAFGLGEAATVAAQFSAVGIHAGQDMTAALQTVADVAQISGRSLTDVGTIFSSIAAKGKLDGQDMLQLTSSGIPVLQLLSDQLGVTTADVSAMVSQGKIDFATFSAAMQAGMGGAALNAGTTFSGALSNVQAAMSRLGASGITPTLDALRIVFIGLIPVIDSITAAMQPAMDALGPQLQAAATSAVDAFGELGGVLGPQIASAMPAVTQALVSLISIMPSLVGSFGQLMPSISQVAANLLPLLAQTMVSLTPVVVMVIGLIAQMLPGITQLAAQVLPLLVAAFAAVVPIVVQVVSGIVDFVATHQTLMGVLGIVAGSVLAVVAAYRAMVIIQTVTGFIRTFTTALHFIRSAQMASMTATALSTAGYTANASAIGVVTAAQSALNAVMAVNPFILITIAVIAFVAILVLLWNRCEGFRNAVTGIFENVKSVFLNAFEQIKTVAGSVAEWFNGTLVPALQTAWNAISTAALWLWQNVFVPAWQGIKNAVAVFITYWVLVYEFLIKPVVDAIAFAALWLWQNVFVPAWQGIKNAVADVAEWFTSTLLPTLQLVWTAIQIAALWLWQNVFVPAWQGIRSVVSGVATWFTVVLIPTLQLVWATISTALSWVYQRFSEIWNGIRDWIVQPVINWFTNTVIANFIAVKDNVVSAFNAMKDGIGTAWDAIKELAAAPVRFVVNTVVAKVVDTYNTVASKFGADTVDVPHVDFWAGGYTGAGARLTPAGVVHKGEVVWSQKDVARWGGVGVVEAMRTWRGYDTGGIVGDDSGGAFSILTDILSKGPVEYLKGLFSGLMDSLGSSGFVQIVKNIPPAIAEILGNYLKEKLAALFSSPISGLPVDGVITSPYGYRVGPYNGYELHDGVDIAAAAGTPVKSMLAGMVKQAGWAGGYGNMVTILSGAIEMFYAHLQDILVRAGASVHAGQIIGTVGSTGWSTGPHLHWGAKKDGRSVDPMSLISGGGSGNWGGAGGAERWRSTAIQAMQMAGLPMQYLDLLMHRMNVESGGNPMAINNWDSNAAAGTPSKGLMQTIDPTFYAHAGPLAHLGPYNPLANIYAAIRYSLARYGLSGIWQAWGGTAGYARGTTHARRGLAWVGEEGPELVNFRGGEKVWTADESRRLTGATIVFSPTYSDERSVRRDFEDFRDELKKLSL